MRGHTLFELLVVLALLGVGASILVPSIRRLADRLAVRGAREEVVGAIAGARGAALSHGGAVVTIRARPPTISVEGGGIRLRTLHLADADGVVLTLSGGRDSTRLRYDRTGVGRFANVGLTLRRGQETAGIFVSSYGRVRRW